MRQKGRAEGAQGRSLVRLRRVFDRPGPTFPTKEIFLVNTRFEDIVEGSMKQPTLDIANLEIEINPPPMGVGIDTQIELLLNRMRPRQAVVLPAAIAYKALIKSMGMGLQVDLRVICGSDTDLRLYLLPT